MPAKLPDALRRPELPDYTIATMPVGSEYHVPTTALVVDSAWNCYLRPEARITQAGFITVKRSDDGYHVIFQVRAQLGPEDPTEREKSKLIPVTTVNVPQ